jgi:DNA-binding response OmpR family regulator
MSERGQMPRILIIDDDPSIRLLIKKILGASDIEVIEAENGAQGLELAAQHEPDLILCDVMMPVMDGMGFLQEWSSRKDLPHIPIVMITSVTERARIIDAVKFGACDYVVKPFDPLGVRTKITKLLKETSSRAAGA